MWVWVVAAVAWVSLALAFPVATANVTGFALRSPATLIHEFFHALVATITGGIPVSLRMTSPIDASLKSIHWTILSRVATPAAGYVMTPIAGLVLVSVGKASSGTDWASVAYGATLVIGLACFVLSRDAMSVLASAWLVVLSAVMMRYGWLPVEWFGLGVAVMGAVEAGRLFVLHCQRGSDMDSDATALSWRVIPPVLHAAVWAGMSVVTLLISVFVMTAS